MADMDTETSALQTLKSAFASVESVCLMEPKFWFLRFHESRRTRTHKSNIRWKNNWDRDGRKSTIFNPRTHERERHRD